MAHFVRDVISRESEGSLRPPRRHPSSCAVFSGGVTLSDRERIDISFVQLFQLVYFLFFAPALACAPLAWETGADGFNCLVS